MYRPKDVAEKLRIAPSTLRIWSQHFANQLSNAARKAPSDGAGPAAQRRYTDADVHTLSQAKAMLTQGLTYDEVKRQMRDDTEQQTTSTPAVANQASPTQVVFSEEAQSSLIAMKEALSAKDKTVVALKESLAFMDAYLQAIRDEREEARERTHQLEKEMDKLRAQNRDLTEKLTKRWWKILMGLP